MAGKKPVIEYMPPRHIDCCYVGCQTRATIRVWTATGWGNVCVGHYVDIKTVPRIDTSPVAVATREIYAKRKGGASYYEARKTKADPGPLPIGIPLDELERELADLANP
jgi:hypothetical protein